MCQHPPFDEDNSAKMMVVEGERFGGYTDRHWVVQSDYAIPWLNITNYIIEDSIPFVAGVNELIAEAGWPSTLNIERLLRYYTAYALKVHVENIPRVMAVIREIEVDTFRSYDVKPYTSTKLDMSKYLVKHRGAMNTAVANCGDKNTEI